MDYYGGAQMKKFEWMCQYLLDKDDVRTLTVSRVIQCWGLGNIAEVQTGLDTTTNTNSLLAH